MLLENVKCLRFFAPFSNDDAAAADNLPWIAFWVNLAQTGHFT